MADLNTIIEKYNGALQIIDGKVCKVVEDSERYINSLKDFVENGYFICEFGSWKGDFNCDGLNLTSLKGCPEEVTGTFDCHKNPITSLNGCPKKVGKDFICNHCPNLDSYSGCPDEVPQDFVAYNNKGIKDLFGTPSKIGRNCDVSDGGLVDLSGKPESIGGQFITIGNKGLK